ncbi:hypothetical protein KKD03_05380 [Patescibacteria group bacterium]|nr:hypothetical protein [Patescibacteria group bacterium]
MNIKYVQGEQIMKIQQLFKQIPLWSVLTTVFLSVLLVVPLTDNFIDHTKTYLLFLSSILMILFFIIKSLRQGSIKITISPITGSLFFFGLAVAASTFFTSSYPIEALLGMGGIYISATLIAILGGSLIPKDSTSQFIKGMTLTSVVLVVATVLQMIGFGPAQLVNKLIGTSFPTSMVFNITGSSFIALQVLLVTLVGAVASIVSERKVSKFFAASLPILVVGAGIFAWSLLPGKDTSLILPAFNSSWSIMLDSLKNPRSALIGVGPSAYSNTYSTFKPLWVNNTAQWSAVFSQARIFPITILTTLGTIGLAAWVFFVVKFAKLKKRSLISSKPIHYMIASTLILQFLLPANTILLTIQAVAIAFLIANEKHRLPLLQLLTVKFKIINKVELDNTPSKITKFPLYLSIVLGLAGVVTMFYFVGRVYAANVLMANSSKALANNEVIKSYELQQKAVALNPYLDTFRRRYASTNMVIAIALSNKADVTEEEKQQISSLLQQAVREAKAATTLDPLDSQNWLSLAQIYKNMIDISEDAADWTVQSYVTAIETNPNDPALRIELAQVFAAQEDYQQAINIMSQAINLKPDLAGSHFNLALILEKVDQPETYREARISYQRTLVLLENGSDEYVIVNQKIEDLETLMEQKGISLEPEQAQQAPTGTESQVPSITEQNLGNPSEVAPVEVENVDFNANPETTETQEIPTTDLSDELN